MTKEYFTYMMNVLFDYQYLSVPWNKIIYENIKGTKYTNSE